MAPLHFSSPKAEGSARDSFLARVRTSRSSAGGSRPGGDGKGSMMYHFVSVAGRRQLALALQKGMSVVSSGCWERKMDLGGSGPRAWRIPSAREMADCGFMRDEASAGGFAGGDEDAGRAAAAAAAAFFEFPLRIRRGKWVLEKNALDKVIRELEDWQRRFDPSWFLIMRLTDPLVGQRERGGGGGGERGGG